MATDESFDAFQQQEYTQIAQAHFKGNESISSFFKYYLLIAAVPLSLFVSILNFQRSQVQGQHLAASAASSAALDNPAQLLSIAFLFVAVLGLLISIYVIQQRFDVILYARQVNLIRRYFYDRGNDQSIYRQGLTLLPRNGHEPSYFELGYFIPVVGAFALVNSAYAGIGISLLNSNWSPEKAYVVPDPIFVLIVAAVVMTVHFILYFLFAQRREKSYLRRKGIGIDIDGVLGDHVPHFCKVAQELHGPIKISPDQIREIPVHRNLDIGLTKDQELAVFRNLSYWTEMPVLNKANQYVRDIRDFGVPVHIVTNRPWPDHGAVTQSSTASPLDQWRDSLKKWIPSLTHRGRWVEIVRLHLCSMREIEIVTRAWLKKHSFPSDEVVVERKPRTHLLKLVLGAPRDRFELARRRGLKYFVEDDPINAAKLALICDFVFLIEQPYNRHIDLTPDPLGKKPFFDGLPNNVVRVDGWDSIYQLIRMLP